MRLKNVPGADEFVANHTMCILEEDSFDYDFSNIFSDAPLHIEVGMGKGQFITSLAALTPDINYIGIERYSSVLLRALQKIDASELSYDNLRLMCADAKNIDKIFTKKKVSKLYLNFSDPWPKDRHAKRRLTSPVFLSKYNDILTSDGTIEFKTDNVDLFDYSLQTIGESKYFELVNHTYDLHNDKILCEGNVMTEYEEKFSSQGNKICKLIARRYSEKI